MQPINFAPETAGSLPERNMIDENWKWNLEDIYPSDTAWEEDFSKIEKTYLKLKDFEGKLCSSAKTLHEALLFEEQILITLEKLFLYAMLLRDSDLRSPYAHGLDDRIKSLGTKVSVACSFITPELLAIDEKVIHEFMEEHNELAIYRHYFDELFRSKQHTLSKELEELLSATTEISGVPYDAFSVFTNADMQFPSLKDTEGNDIQVSHGRYQAALSSPDRPYRERVYKAYYQTYQSYANTLTTLFNGNLKSKAFYAKSRKYLSSREASLDRNNIPVRVYDTLINTASANLEPLHRWMGLKKKLLKLDELHPYDVYTSVFKESEKQVLYVDAVNTVQQSAAILGSEYAEILKTAFSNRWIDVYETKGKRSGAYSSGTTYGVHPYVLLNWNYQLKDVFTLAHEMGHNVHSYLTGKYQPFRYADYSIFLAEIASTFNESLLLDYLIQNSSEKKEKLQLYERYLDAVMATFYRQTMFAEFEMQAYRTLEDGKALTSESLCDLYKSTYSKYMGPHVTVDNEESYTWARVPHFYYNFYVFQYATGFAASEALANKVTNGSSSDVEAYLDFLKAGKSDYPINILKKAGVDMTSEIPVLAVSKKMTTILNLLESEM
ncbi:MAG: oligoendopeptidase F [Ignavibacteria bacterium]|nr:oligoendopeptidase F [Ignavibacteria bacterium]